MTTIKLPTGIFEYDVSKPLGKRGGFGQVFLGITQIGEEVAVKKLHVSAASAGHRELQIAAELRGRTFEHVIAFIDSGEDADTGDYFVVMPKAESSLQALIDKGGKSTPADTAAVMHNVVRGLIEVKDLVHRDLKPDNILLHQGKWKVADFGIARFMTDVTSDNTLKEWMSKLYAAPEQLRLERATSATDIYALGCIGYCLLTGKPPFTIDPQQEHQVSPVPDFQCADDRLKGLIRNMLRKPPEVRTSISRVEGFLAEIVSKPPSSNSADSFSVLASVGAQISDKAQQAEAKREAEQKVIAARNRVAKAAFEILADNVERLWGKIHTNTLVAQRSGMVRGMFEVSIGEASLMIKTGDEYGSATQPGKFRYSGWDVIAMSSVSVLQKNPEYRWSASLLYAKIKGQDEYRWHEIGYWRSFGQVHFEPFAVADIEQADNAAAGILGGTAIACGPWLIDDEKESEFHDRWVWLLARAANKQLRHPSRIPFGWPPQF
jgi:serine/threonine-protein kinase